MRRAVLLALIVAGIATGSAQSAGGPFYLVPSTTHECQNVHNCTGVPGPWVDIPPHTVATYLFACPARRNFVVGGTDARTTSAGIRVWFEGKLGGPLGSLPNTVNGRATLLFHARVTSGRRAAFQPILGCVSLVPKNKRSTLAAVPGRPAGPPLDLRAQLVGLRLGQQLPPRTLTLRCPRGEKLVGSWSAVASDTTQPPAPVYAASVHATTRIAGGRVHALVTKSRVFGPLAPRSWAQIGAMCEP